MTDEVFKYPRTWHLPWSRSLGSDDKRILDLARFRGNDVVVTVKMDGENTSLYKDRLHARSLDYAPHPSRTWMRKFHGEIAWQLRDGERVCGENLFAKHSIHYLNLKSYFLAFGLWQGKLCLDWDTTLARLRVLGIEPVPVLYEGPFHEKLVQSLASSSFAGDPMEGYVLRNRGAFTLETFGDNVAKYVRPNHVTTDEHWMHQPVVANELLGGMRRGET